MLLCSSNRRRHSETGRSMTRRFWTPDPVSLREHLSIWLWFAVTALGLLLASPFILWLMWRKWWLERKA